MRSPTIIRNDLTVARYGYSSGDAKPHDSIIVECKTCNTVYRKELRSVNRLHICPAVVGSNKRCYKCGEWKDLTQFNVAPKQSGGVAKLCKICYNGHSAVIASEARRNRRIKHALKDGDYQYYIKRRTYRMKSRALGGGIPWDIDDEYLVSLWDRQDGKCYYSAIPMSGNGTFKAMASWNSPSLDRKTPTLGYIKDNVVWCLYAINSFKGEMSEQEFKTVTNSIKWWSGFKAATTIDS